MADRSQQGLLVAPTVGRPTSTSTVAGHSHLAWEASLKSQRARKRKNEATYGLGNEKPIAFQRVVVWHATSAGGMEWQIWGILVSTSQPTIPTYEDRLVRWSFLIDQVVDSNLYNLRLFLRQWSFTTTHFSTFRAVEDYITHTNGRSGLSPKVRTASTCSRLQVELREECKLWIERRLGSRLDMCSFRFSSHILFHQVTMKVICFAALVASAAAFTSQPNAFTTQSHSIGERVNDVVVSGGAHRTRRSTIVMDGKANGEFYMILVPATYMRTRDSITTYIREPTYE